MIKQNSIKGRFETSVTRRLEVEGYNDHCVEDVGTKSKYTLIRPVRTLKKEI